MKLVYVITGLGMGGAETQVCGLCDKMYEMGHEVSLVYLTGDKVVHPTNSEIEVYDLKITKGNFLRGFIKLNQIIKKLKPDVIHSHMIHANLISRFCSLFVGKVVLINTAHSANEGGWLRMLMYRITDFLSDVTTNVSSAAVESFIEKKAVKRSRIIAVHNGVDTDKFQYRSELNASVRKQLGVSESCRLFISVGRYVEAKDYSNLLEAISLSEIDCEHKFIIVGLDVERLKAKARELGIDKRVAFLGMRKDVPALLSASDVFVLSSQWEGLPMVVGESMSCECAVVTTDAGGTSEWLPNKDYVVEIKNPRMLSNKIVALSRLSDMQIRALGKENRNYIVGKYSIQSVSSTWVNMYQAKLNINGNA